MRHTPAVVIKAFEIQNLTEREFVCCPFGRPRRRIRDIQGVQLHIALDDRFVRQLLTLGDKRCAGKAHRHFHRRLAAADVHHLAHRKHLFGAARRRGIGDRFRLFADAVTVDVRQHRFLPERHLLHLHRQRTVHTDAARACRPTVDIVYPCRHKGQRVGGVLRGDAAGKRLGAGKRAHAFALLIEIQDTHRALPVDKQLIPAPLAGQHRGFHRTFEYCGNVGAIIRQQVVPVDRTLALAAEPRIQNAHRHIFGLKAHNDISSDFNIHRIYMPAVGGICQQLSRLMG